MFLWECRLWYHLSSCLFALKEPSVKGRRCSVSGRCTPQQLMWQSQHALIRPVWALRVAVLIEHQMLGEGRGCDWKWVFNIFPESANNVGTAHCHVSWSWRSIRKWKHQHVHMLGLQTDTYEAKWVKKLHFLTWNTGSVLTLLHFYNIFFFTHWLTTCWRIGHGFGNLSSCEVRDFGRSMKLNKSNFSPFDFSQESWTRLLSVLFIPVWEHAKERASLLPAVLLLSDVNIHLRVIFGPCVSGLFAVVGLETFSLLRSSAPLPKKDALSPGLVLLLETEMFWPCKAPRILMKLLQTGLRGKVLLVSLIIEEECALI